MILYFALLSAIALALWRGGSLRHLAALDLRGTWLVPIVVGPQLIVIFSPKGYDDRFWMASAAALGVSYFALVILALRNHGLPGMKLLALGLILNLLVILANGGFMPVTAENVAQAGHADSVVELQTGTRVASSKDIVLKRKDTRLWFLSDVFVIPRQCPLAGSFSIGDLLIMSGSFVLVQWAFFPAAGEPKVGKARCPRGVK